jgi:hypothetical protein
MARKSGGLDVGEELPHLRLKAFSLDGNGIGKILHIRGG